MLSLRTKTGLREVAVRGEPRPEIKSWSVALRLPGSSLTHDLDLSRFAADINSQSLAAYHTLPRAVTHILPERGL